MKTTHKLNVLAAFSPVLVTAFAISAGAQEILPYPQPPFKGHIGRTAKDSTQDFPKDVRAPKGAPNILLILTDDVGFGASTTFGGPIPTPTMDRLAKNGLRYTQFHTTALSSPTRAALLSGRNHHSNATGVIMELGTGFPGYNTLMPKSCGTFAEVLKQNGYNTAWYGKNHNVPDWHTSQVGPFDLWPTGLGFEYFYGFIGGDTSQWAPALFENIKPIEPPHNQPDYFFDKDMADHAIARIRLLHAIAPKKPWVTYYAPGTAHAPHHAPKDWIAKFKGKFDRGWDKMREETLARQKALGIVPPNTQLTPRPKDIQAWDSLDADHKKVYAHMMEVYAAALSYCDTQMGRILDALEDMGELDNTLVIYIQGDNGASAEGTPQGLLNEMSIFNNIPEDFKQVAARMDELGGPNTFNHYPVGWAHAMDTPFKYAKGYASHYGGTANGLVISWPARIKDRGGIRPQWHHTIDIVPTIYEATGVGQPSIVNGVAQKPIEGVGMSYSFNDAKVPSNRRTQYFEMFGLRAIYHDGWVACTTPPTPLGEKADPKEDVVTGYQWELYNTTQDFSEAVNLADKNPEKLEEMQLLFYAEAAKYNVLPLDNNRIPRVDVSIRPSLTRGRNEFTYYGTMARIPEGAAPDVKNKSFRVTAEVMLPKGGEDGVLVTQGGLSGGWALMLKANRPVFHYNFANVAHYDVAADSALSPGKHTVVFDFRYDGGGIGKGGTGVITVDGKQVAQGRIEHTMPVRLSLDETFDVGEDTGTPVSLDYDVPFAFTGTLDKVVIQLGDTKLTAADEQRVRGLEQAARRSIE